MYFAAGADAMQRLLCAGLSSHGVVEVKSYEVSDSAERYDFKIIELPFSYADTGWLVEAGVFQSVDEACAEDRGWLEYRYRRGRCLDKIVHILAE